MEKFNELCERVRKAKEYIEQNGVGRFKEDFEELIDDVDKAYSLMNNKEKAFAEEMLLEALS